MDALRLADRIVSGRAGDYRQTGAARVAGDGFRHLRGFGAQSVVQVRHVHGRAAPAPGGDQAVEQGHGIRSARDGGDDRVVWTKAGACQGRVDAILHLPNLTAS